MEEFPCVDFYSSSIYFSFSYLFEIPCLGFFFLILYIMHWLSYIIEILIKCVECSEDSGLIRGGLSA